MATLRTSISSSSHPSAIAGMLPHRAFLLLCGLLAFVLLGYHPFAEDGGIYASALSLRLNPSLFPAYRGFVVAHTGRSVFIPAIAEIVRWSRLSQDAVLLLLYVLSVVATIFAADLLAEELIPSLWARCCSVLLFSAALGMPIAGTSLYLADPYLTARSISTPLILLALACILRRRTGMAALCFAATVAIHPLMGAWALLLAAFLLIWERSRRPALYSSVLGCAAVAAMALLQMLLPAESPAVRAAAISRGYWFLSQWQWFEWIGLVAPLLMLLWFAAQTWGEDCFRPQARVAAAAAAASIVTVWAASLLLVHTANANFFLARTQPLRLLHTTTAVFVLLLGGWIAQAFRNRRLRWVPFGCVLAAAMGLVVMQRGIYGSSGYWEFPHTASPNGYVNAFRWIRERTPQDAVIAADAHYTTDSGEDAQMIRAIALRSSVPDAAKDGGIASVMPSLAETWQRDSTAQLRLAMLTDAERTERLKGTGATWMVLPADASTSFPCPYRNAIAKVCRLGLFPEGELAPLR